MNARGCYRELWESHPEVLRSRGVPKGFCGRCETCGEPGHTRHFPGGVPYTGTWCDRHYRRLRVLHPLAFPGLVSWTLVLAVVVASAFAALIADRDEALFLGRAGAVFDEAAKRLATALRLFAQRRRAPARRAG